MSNVVQLPTPGVTGSIKERDDALMLIQTLTSVRLQGQPITASDVIDLSGGKCHALVLDWIKQNTQITVQDLKKAQWARKVRDELGCVPQNPGELVQAVVDLERASYKYNGMIAVEPIPYILDEQTGEKAWVTPEDIATVPDIAEYVAFHFPKEIDRREFALKLRVHDTNLRLGFGAQPIEDALDAWTIEARKQRRFDLFAAVGKPLNAPQRLAADQMWKSVVANGFHTDQTVTPAFVIAVLQKFIWQVKRKMRGLPVSNHLMPVITGVQGGGKSTFVRAMMKPLEELSLNVDFKAICDDRNIDIWESYMLFVDEMGYASKTDIDTVKNAITAETLSRRPMRSNSYIGVRQNATFIGCSNKTLEQLIKDPTGIRRFIALEFSDTTDENKQALNSVDWAMLWRSVDHQQADPTANHVQALQQVQEESRELGRVERWLEQFDPDLPDFKLHLHLGTIRATDLYDLFREFEDRAYPGGFKSSETDFGSEMKRLERVGLKTQVFAKKRTNKGYIYTYRGQI